jgi:hypothetical protein
MLGHARDEGELLPLQPNGEIQRRCSSTIASVRCRVTAFVDVGRRVGLAMLPTISAWFLIRTGRMLPDVQRPKMALGARG